MTVSFSPEQEYDLHVLYFSGKNDYEVAKEMHVGRNRLREWRNIQGIPSKTNKKGLSAGICPDIMEMMSMGSDLTGVAKSMA